MSGTCVSARFDMCIVRSDENLFPNAKRKKITKERTPVLRHLWKELLASLLQSLDSS